MGKINMDFYSNILKINDFWVMVFVGGGVVNGNVVNMYLFLKFKIFIV